MAMISPSMIHGSPASGSFPLGSQCTFFPDNAFSCSAIRFTFFVLVVALVVLGFAGMIVTLFRHVPFAVPAMALPTLGMLALAIADARYLWLEHEGGDTDED